MRLDPGQIEVMDDLMARVLRSKTHAERIQIGFSIWNSTIEMLRAFLIDKYPSWDQTKIQQEIMRRMRHGSP